MPEASRKCWLTFEGGCQDQPVLWQLSQAHPAVRFDVRQASVSAKIGIMALQLTAPDDDHLAAALTFLEDKGVRVDPVEGGSLVVG
ncbi:MAG: NIL domain-containing protein [Planctomycetota bacterium]